MPTTMVLLASAAPAADAGGSDAVRTGLGALAAVGVVWAFIAWSRRHDEPNELDDDLRRLGRRFPGAGRRRGDGGVAGGGDASGGGVDVGGADAGVGDGGGPGGH